ncbi:MAG: rhomboid family intramembrane serine protease [Chitinispirillia bacterium]|nr:rhomboid family intramembrane serine protease [Chitinispirillia bacterium]MCL2268252.1 rhomboid family intramembrane serine protease [Chitinispirillia bacterium]
MYYESPRLTPCIKGLIAANVIVFIVQMLPRVGDFVTYWGGNNPYDAFIGYQAWRLVTYMFLHSPDMLFHILFNMLALWWFGMELEEMWGAKKFLTFYFVCGTGAGFFSVFYLFINPNVLVIGASGAVLGILTAFAHYYPDRQILLFFIIPMRIRTLVIGYALISVLMSLREGAGGTSHITHLGGIVVAWCYIKIYPSVAMAVRKKMYIWQNRPKKR